MIELRPYQKEGVEDVFNYIFDKKRIIRQLPTGGGKTVEFAYICQRYVLEEKKAILILVHRIELLKQAYRTIVEVTGIEPSIIDSNTRHWKKARIYIGMIGSLERRLTLMHDVGMIIIDECHMQNFVKAHDIFYDKYILGVTATPLSVSKKKPLNNYYEHIILGPQIKELISAGHLSQNITRIPSNFVDSSKLKVDSWRGDFNEKMMAAEFRKKKYVTNVVREYFNNCFGSKTIVFNVNIEHSKEVNDCFIFCGHNSKHLDSDSSKRPSSDPRFENEREEILNWFKVTPDAILNSVMIPTVGFDEPTIRNVILNFSTLSLVKFLQCSGRGGRIITGIKDWFNIIDMGGNYQRFGEWSDDRDWGYIYSNPGTYKEGVPIYKTCPKCEGLVYAAVSICNLKDKNGDPCLYEFNSKKKVFIEDEIGEMVVVTKGIDIDEMTERYKNKYDYYTFFELATGIVNALFEINERPSQKKIDEAFNVYYNLCIEWYKKYMAGKDGNIDDITDSQYHIVRAKNNFNKLINKKIKELDLKIPIQQNVLVYQAS